MAWWPKGAHSPTAGAMMVSSDIDSFILSADYDTLGDTQKMALNSTYALVASDCETPVLHYGVGHPGSGDIVPRIDMIGCPNLGNPVELQIYNGLGGGYGVLFISAAGRFNGVVKECPVLVSPPYLLVPMNLVGTPGAAGEGFQNLRFTVPDDNGLLGLQINMQFLGLDAGASRGISGTDGIEYVHGEN